ELLENAIDAGATQITLSIVRGGIQQLQIADNGSGIEAEYIDKAFVRHATSKITSAEDLGHIHTLGFRGEALASIASVARVEVLTRTEADEYACCYRIEGGEPQGMEPGARPRGTTVTVNDLFYNTPARMKFLKKDVSEGTFVADIVLHEALSHPEIAFRFLRDGKQQFMTPGDGQLRSAAYAVLGREFARDLLPLDGDGGVYKVTGLVTPPRACRASRSAQHFYVNGRYVKNRTMMAALENAYKGTLMQGKYPGAILRVDMPADLVDVNVHPAKTEIRFARESDVFDAVYRTVRAALAAPGSGECRFDLGHVAKENPQPAPQQTTLPGSAPAQSNPQRPAVAPAQPPQPQKHFNTLSAAEYRALNKLTAPVPARTLPGTSGVMELNSVRAPFNAPSTPQFAASAPHTAQEDLLDILPDLPEQQPKAEPAVTTALAQQPAPAQLENIESPELPEEEKSATGLSALPITHNDPTAQADIPPEQTTFAPTPASLPLRVVGEVFKTYIITERNNELCLIDKHAAHERILFEQLAKDYGSVPSQMLLVPVQVNLSAEEKQALLAHQELLQNSGVEVDDYGGFTVVVRAVPADVPVDDVGDMVLELANHLMNGGRDALREKTEWVLHSIACRAAIKAGDRTTTDEMLALAQKIMDGSVPPFCPHGRPCVLKLTRKELEKQFGRLV
ncbi:MAG TPA: DNA mismatch repair endonuclease MutL, partial [Ruminococcaceae bacterium]|nr:DNA mismatch repair endonuclease MutL [Oscillospiraceae bacterium]